MAIVVKASQRFIGQRLQRLFVVLTGGLELGAVAVAQRLQVPITPARAVGDEDDAPGVADQQRVAALAPLALQLRKFQLDHHRAEELAVVARHGAGEKVPRDAAGHAHRIKTSGALGAGLEEIRTKAIVVPDIAAGQAPVAGRDGQACVVEQFQGG
ncbi:hypothetical protein D3C76_1286520 [compost metagenome]